MAQKFKVGDKVEDFQRYGVGEVSGYSDGGITVEFKSGKGSDSYEKDGRYFYFSDAPSLRLTGRPFNVGDKVVIGGEKGVVSFVSKGDTKTPVNVEIENESPQDEIWLTADGRAWPGTPIIAEHDWEEEESDSETGNETENHAADAIEYRERNKGVDVSPGFGKDWPIDNGIEDVTVNIEEVRHIAEMQEQAVGNRAESEFLKEQYNYTRMALTLTGFKVDNEAAALITETVKKVLELGGEFSLKTACEVEARVNQMYNEANI